MSQVANPENVVARLEHATAALEPLLDALETALAHEAGALIEGGGATLLDAVESKQQRLRELDRALAQEGISALLRELSTADLANLAEVPSWQTFTTRLRQLRDMNLAAGSAIALAQRQTQVGLELLGQGGTANAYDQSGRTGTDRRSRDLARC